MELEKHLANSQQDYQIRTTINKLYHNVLENYIAQANSRDVLEGLYRFYTESDVVLISKAQLKVYQELEKLSLSLSELDLNSKPPLYVCGCGKLHPVGFVCSSLDNETT